MALQRDGTMLSLRYRVIDDYGAYLQFGYGTHGNAFSQVVGPYRINSAQARVIAVLTNKCQQGAYRGFGSEVTNFVLERMADAAAEELSIDPVALRRRNLIQPAEFPYVIPSGNVYDSGNYPAVLDEALRLFDYQAWRQKQEEARRAGPLSGDRRRNLPGAQRVQRHRVLVAEPAGHAGLHPDQLARRRRDQHRSRPARSFVKLNAPFWGNSPETVATQVVAEHCSVDPSDISVGYRGHRLGLQWHRPGRQPLHRHGHRRGRRRGPDADGQDLSASPAT